MAGYEVVAHTLAFTLYLVAEHEDVAKQIREELDDVLAGGDPSIANLGQLTYLEMVLKESMRLLPVTTVLTRQTAAPVELGGYSLPKNRLVLFAPWVLQRDSDYWDEPLAFRPKPIRSHKQTINPQIRVPSILCWPSRVHWQHIRHDADENKPRHDLANVASIHPTRFCF